MPLSIMSLERVLTIQEFKGTDGGLDLRKVTIESDVVIDKGESQLPDTSYQIKK